MKSRRRLAIACALPLAACATTPERTPAAAHDPGSAETITLAVGPCFGFCPVYAVSVSPAGEVVFNGERHTAVLGERRRSVGEATYRTVARDLGSYRPPSGSRGEVDCSAAVSDTSSLTLTWTDAAGRETVATVSTGCPGGRGRGLAEVLGTLPDRLGVAPWAKQKTREGASRG